MPQDYLFITYNIVYIITNNNGYDCHVCSQLCLYMIFNIVYM